MIQVKPPPNVYRTQNDVYRTQNDLIPGEFVVFLFMVMGLFYLKHVANQACIRHNGYKYC